MNTAYAVTTTQKTILEAFDMAATDIQKQANTIGSNLFRIEREELENSAFSAPKEA